VIHNIIIIIICFYYNYNYKQCHCTVSQPNRASSGVSKLYVVLPLTTPPWRPDDNNRLESSSKGSSCPAVAAVHILVLSWGDIYVIFILKRHCLFYLLFLTDCFFFFLFIIPHTISLFLVTQFSIVHISNSKTVSLAVISLESE